MDLSARDEAANPGRQVAADRAGRQDEQHTGSMV
jgi:hypothetical protein